MPLPYERAEADPSVYRFVCSNTECRPVGRKARVLRERSYYALSPEAEQRWHEGKHPGCPRCGWPLDKREN